MRKRIRVLLYGRTWGTTRSASLALIPWHSHGVDRLCGGNTVHEIAVHHRIIADLTFRLDLNIGMTGSTYTIRGKCWVVDADDISVNGERIRLAGLDAPESDQIAVRWDGTEYPQGEVVKRMLCKKIGNKRVEVMVHGEDKFGRKIGTVFYEGKNINQFMVREGWAISAFGEQYWEDEAFAYFNKKGMWRDKIAYDPRAWKHGKKKRIWHSVNVEKDDSQPVTTPPVSFPQRSRSTSESNYESTFVSRAESLHTYSAPRSVHGAETPDSEPSSRPSYPMWVIVMFVVLLAGIFLFNSRHEDATPDIIEDEHIKEEREEQRFLYREGAIFSAPPVR